MYVKFMLYDRTDNRYMTHLVVKKGNNTLYDVSTTKTTRYYQQIRLLTQNTNTQPNLEAIVTFNTNEQYSKIVPIRKNTLAKINELPTVSKEDRKVINYHLTHPTLWKATSFDEAIKILYGTSKTTPVKTQHHSNFLSLNGDATFPVGCTEQVTFSVSPEVESIMLLASYKKNVVQYVIHIPDTPGYGFSISQYTTFSEHIHQNITTKLKSFTAPVTNLGYLKNNQKGATIALVYRLKNGKVFQQNFKPFVPGCCGTEPRSGEVHIELTDTP